MFQFNNRFALVILLLTVVVNVKATPGIFDPDFPDEDEGVEGWWGRSNDPVGEHGYQCDSDSTICIDSANLVCTKTSDGKHYCNCKPDFVYYSRLYDCLKISTQKNNSCRYSLQCTSGSWGMYSKCNTLNNKCECFSENNTISYLENGICHNGKNCKSDVECSSLRAVCNVGKCTYLPKTHIFLDSIGICVPLATKLGDKCVATEQCQQGALGKYSRCSMTEHHCECSDLHGNAAEHTAVYHEQLNKSFLRKQYNESCTSNEECQASLGPCVRCGQLEGENEKSVCYCPKGKVCRSEEDCSRAWNTLGNVLYVFVALVLSGFVTSY